MGVDGRRCYEEDEPQHGRKARKNSTTESAERTASSISANRSSTGNSLMMSASGLIETSSKDCPWKDTAVRDSCHPLMSEIGLTLRNSPLWHKFHSHGTEMIITKTGRRMFPSIRVSVFGLEADSRYFVMLEAALSAGSRYKFTGTGEWSAVGAAEPQTPASTRLYLHPDSPALGSTWMQQDILFHRVKLTNNTLDNQGNLVLTSMHKYQPRIHIIKASDILAVHWSPTVTFTFPQTEFIAVTAYQNEKITKLKIDNNPFAKGFRENGQARTKRKMMESKEFDKVGGTVGGMKQRKTDDSEGSASSAEEEVDVISCGTESPRVRSPTDESPAVQSTNIKHSPSRMIDLPVTSSSRLPSLDVTTSSPVKLPPSPPKLTSTPPPLSTLSNLDRIYYPSAWPFPPPFLLHPLPFHHPPPPPPPPPFISPYPLPFYLPPLLPHSDPYPSLPILNLKPTDYSIKQN